MEVIDSLRMKTAIMDVLNAFRAAEVEVGSTLIHPEEGAVEEAEPDPRHHQRSDSLKGYEDVQAQEQEQDEVGGHKSHKDGQGISIDEMAATTVRETLLLQKNKWESII